jgi:amino acid transporter
MGTGERIVSFTSPLRISGTIAVGSNRCHQDQGEAMNIRPTGRAGKPSASSVASFVLGLCALVATSLTAILWHPIDQDLLNRADAAGWDTRMLLPHQTELSLLIDASVLATFVVAVTAFIGMMASRRRAEASAAAHPQARV